METPVRRPLLAALPIALCASAAYAEVPAVATDIAPVHGLVARVMDGVGTPDLVIRPGASPHEYSLRPSEAASLERADVVFWMGEALTPWLAGTIDTLAGDANVVELLAASGTVTHEFRVGATFEAHDHGDHGHEDHSHGDHSHDEHSHDDHSHDDHAHDGHGHDEHAHDHGHSHEGVDPHAWLDPENAKVWLDLIAAELSALDPANAALYAANAAEGRAEIAAAAAEAAMTVAPLKDRGFIVFHDAYQYFEERFGLAAAGAITLGDATTPSPARIAEIREAVTAFGVACVFSEPQFDPGLVAAVVDGTGAVTSVIDPLGMDIAPGPGFYPALLRELAGRMADCL
jgi:zinc transport system substrate-binding protein